MIENPFTNRGMIKDEAGFVGREAEITNILSRVRNGDSASIVGDRRIGKSSLLYHLFLTANYRLQDEGAQKYQLIFFDLQDPQFAQPTAFCQKLCAALNSPLDDAEKQGDGLSQLARLSERLEARQATGPLPVLLMDEFEKFTEKPERFTDDFYNALRAFGNQHKLTMITASMHTLRHLTETSGLTSPLHNIFMVQNLGEFIVSDVVNEVEAFLTRFWRTAPIRQNATCAA